MNQPYHSDNYPLNCYDYDNMMFWDLLFACENFSTKGEDDSAQVLVKEQIIIIRQLPLLPKVGRGRGKVVLRGQLILLALLLWEWPGFVRRQEEFCP